MACQLRLRASGFDVTTTSSASEVVSNAENAGVELIIMDINFAPGEGSLDWSGYTVLQWLRRFPKLAKIPVILISGEASDKHSARALADGAVAFFQKPVSYPDLLATILHALNPAEPASE